MLIVLHSCTPPSPSSSSVWTLKTLWAPGIQPAPPSGQLVGWQKPQKCPVPQVATAVRVVSASQSSSPVLQPRLNEGF